MFGQPRIGKLTEELELCRNDYGRMRETLNAIKS